MKVTNESLIKAVSKARKKYEEEQNLLKLTEKDLWEDTTFDFTDVDAAKEKFLAAQRNYQKWFKYPFEIIIEE